MALLEREEELAAVASLRAAGGVLLIEGRAGIGKTALVEAACAQATAQGCEVLHARGAVLETGFAFGVVRQLVERRLSDASPAARELLLAGPAARAWALLGSAGSAPSGDASFTIVHGLYWLVANLASSCRLVLAVDDAHLADRASLRWLGYLAPRAREMGLSLLLALRQADLGVDPTALASLRRHAAVVLRPRLLSADAVAAVAGEVLGERAEAALCSRLTDLSGGNPFYLRQLLQSIAGACVTADWPREGALDVLYQLEARLRRLGPAVTGFAQAMAVLGDGGALRQATVLAGLRPDEALRAVVALVDSEVLLDTDPPRFVHPILRDAVEMSLDRHEREVLHRAAAALLHADRAPAGHVAAHLRGLTAAGDAWVCDRLREAAAAMLASGAPQEAAELLSRAWAEPPPVEDQLAVLRELARVEAMAGRATARDRLDEALARTGDHRERARIGLEVAQAHADLFRWVDAVDVVERAVAELGDIDAELTGRLQAQLVVAGLHDARRAALVVSTLSHLAGHPPSHLSVEAVAVADGMAALLVGRPAADIARPMRDLLSARLAPVADWNTRAALLWCLVTAEDFDAVEGSIGPMLDELGGTGSARGLIAVHSSLGFLKLRLGALPEADAASRVAQRVMEGGDFTPGLPFAVAVRAEVAVEAGQLDRARGLLERFSADLGPAGVGTVLVPAAWGRLHLAAGRHAEALAAFRTCAQMFAAEVWGFDIRDVGYLHARSGAAAALLGLGDRDQACHLADAELADVRRFGAPRALGVALRTAGLAYGGGKGLDLLAESVATLNGSPAALERAKSLAELGAAQHRAGRRRIARENLTEALDLAARCGARPLAYRIREQLKSAGARPRREWRRGAESLTPAELRIARLAAQAKTNREIAQSLYITVKTVEGHLAHVYAKLGIAGRHELRAALHHDERQNPRVPIR